MGLAAASGCGDGEAAQTTGGTGRTVTVWFADESGALVAETRPASGGEPLEAAMRALAEGPSRPGLVPALPAGTRVLSAAVEEGVATVNLSAEFESGFPAGGSAAELAVLGPLVTTAAGAAGTPLVRVLVEGRAPAPPDGQLDLSVPLSPADVAAGG